MAYRYVVQVGDEVLRNKSEEVRKFDGELAALLDDMKETVRKEDGAGLAAPQIGVNLRVVVIDLEEGFFEMVNPKILSVKGEQRGEEGCLSVKGKQGIVTRPNKVKAEYRDRKGKKHTVTGTGLFARCMCHEFDHLDGVLYIDRAEEVYDVPLRNGAGQDE
ncbi:MAG: peptide deformylase [Clostridia bacterium]|nr:peptide deformylase [Clostridia bacterium]